MHKALKIAGKRVLCGDRDKVHVLDMASLMRDNSVAFLLVKVAEQLVELSFPLLG
jgi:hypothetical protein